jgi:hypothetical protein
MQSEFAPGEERGKHEIRDDRQQQQYEARRTIERQFE